MLDVNVYLGKSEAGDGRETNVGMKAVIRLCDAYYNTKRCIIADNFFMSILLCLHLWKKGLEYIGTIRSQNSNHLFEKQIKRCVLKMRYL